MLLVDVVGIPSGSKSSLRGEGTAIIRRRAALWAFRGPLVHAGLQDRGTRAVRLISRLPIRLLGDSAQRSLG